MRILIFAILFIPITAKKYSNIRFSIKESFDVSEKWPQCKDVFNDIQIQGNCSSSWAISVATSIRDRRCIKSGLKEPISAYDLISCCQDCQLDGKNGCNGGDHHSAFQFFLNDGIVTGGAFQSNEGCKPYPISPDLKANMPTQTECVYSCDSSYKLHDYDSDKSFGRYQLTFSQDNTGVMTEIMANGPVVAEFKLYDDLLNYTGGIYQHKTGKLHGYYYAKILGWGTDENGLSFWRAAASFGSNRGENGTFRIKRGNNECEFESNIIGAIVEDNIKRTTPVPPKPVDLDCQKITAYYYGIFEDSEEDFYVDIQIKADINLQDNRIYFQFDGWDKKNANGYWVFLFNETNMFNETNVVECNTTQTVNCSIPFHNLSFFRTYIWPFNRSHWTDLMNVDPISNNRFTLEQAIGKCSTGVRNNNPRDTNPSLYQSCFCCGDKYDPHPSLKCPASPWKKSK